METPKTMTATSPNRPTIWVRAFDDGEGRTGYELYVHNPKADPRWAEFRTFAELLDWIRTNPGVFFSKEEMSADHFLQLSFDTVAPGFSKNG